jgi:hypothetical protein
VLLKRYMDAPMWIPGQARDDSPSRIGRQPAPPRPYLLARLVPFGDRPARMTRTGAFNSARSTSARYSDKFGTGHVEGIVEHAVHQGGSPHPARAS